MKENKKITITKDSIVGDVQRQFESVYPFLKIYFFQNNPTTSSQNEQFDVDHILGRTIESTAPVTLNIEEDRTVAELEKECLALLGLSIQIFRKSGKVWNAITLTNDWTLQSQNEAAEFISAEMKSAS